MRSSLDGFGSGYRTLTDVKEEPHDKDEDHQMINGFEESGEREGKQIRLNLWLILRLTV